MEVGEYELTRYDEGYSLITFFKSYRKQNIARNEAFLKDIGLFEVKERIEEAKVAEPKPKRKYNNLPGDESLIRRKSTRLNKSELVEDDVMLKSGSNEGISYHRTSTNKSN
jgi:hypothetical protein